MAGFLSFVLVLRMDEKTWAIVTIVAVVGLCAAFFWAGLAGLITLLSGLILLLITKIVEQKRQEELDVKLENTKDVVTDKLDGIAREVESVGNVLVRSVENTENEKRFSK